MPTTGHLSQIDVMRADHTLTPEWHQISALVDQIISDWATPSAVADTARLGVAEEDKQAIAELIASHHLTCSAAEVEAALLAECQRIAQEREQRV